MIEKGDLKENTTGLSDFLNKGKIVRIKNIRTLVRRAPFPLFIMTCLFLFANNAHADLKDDFQEKIVDFTKTDGEPDSSSFIKPVSKLTLQGFYYSDYLKKTYCFENAEGRCLDKEFNPFAAIEGKGRVDDKYYIYYKTELNEDGQLRLKKAYGLMKAGIWSLEAGKDTVWVGPGYHGSLILSNNAEGFLLVRVRTEEPFRLPWLLSYLGEFKYDLFRGWSDNSSILGHRLSWRPMPLLEIGGNQVVYIAPGKNYSISEYPHVFVSSNENSWVSGDQSAPKTFDNDQKASIDIALDMPFLSKITPFINGKLYAEYGGNDSFAAWQKEDKATFKTMWKRQDTKWVWPIGLDFLNIGWLAGLFLTTGDVDFRVEYAENYDSYPLFYDLYDELGGNRRHGPWYTHMNTRDGMIMGHQMGNMADDLFFEITLRHNPASLKINFDQERRGFSNGSGNNNNPPETRYQYGLRPSYRFKTYTLFADLIYNHYRNVNFSNDALSVDVHPGTRLDEYIAGLGMEISF